MSFISVDFEGARLMADEIETMGKDCAAMAVDTGLEELVKLAADLEEIATDILNKFRRDLDDSFPDFASYDGFGGMKNSGGCNVWKNLY